MSTAAHYPHIYVDADGVARIEQTRYKVAHLAAEHFQHGWTAEELLRQHPDLKPEQVYATLTYFYDHHDEIVAELEASLDDARKSLDAHGLSREELLKRRANTAS